MQAPATLYAASYIVEAPAPTLDSIRAELLPLARICGYNDVCVGCSTSQYGSNYSATAHGPGGTVAALANILDHPTASDMRDAAFNTLYTKAGASGATL